VRILTIAMRATLPVVAVVAALAARPAVAQISLGSPGEPPRLELGIGAFDVTPDSHHKDAATAGDFDAEYHFGDVLWIFSPFVGQEVTTAGATYSYFGFGFDINFGPHWVFTPNGAAGAFQPGSGTLLGSWWEFRTGGELDYKFDDQSRLGLAVHHMSNAGLTQRNPGEQSVNLVYQIPLHW
jgi:lipid A 3-O-deacylase